MELEVLDHIQNAYASITAKKNITPPDPDVDAAMAIVLQCELLRATYALTGTIAALVDELKKQPTSGPRLVV